MDLKKVLIVISILLIIMAGCAADSSDDNGDTIAWNQIFFDEFDRTDTIYDPSSDTSLGSNYRAYSDDAAGVIEIDTNEVTTSEHGIAEYQTPLTKKTAKLSVKFSSDTFSTAFQEGVSLLDAITAPAGCQVTAGVFGDGADYKLHIVNKDTASSLASTAVSLTINTQYLLEMYIDEGAVTATIKDSSGDSLATVTASAEDSSDKYIDCLIQEPSFSMRIAAGTVKFDDFAIATAD